MQGSRRSQKLFPFVKTGKKQQHGNLPFHLNALVIYLYKWDIAQLTAENVDLDKLKLVNSSSVLENVSISILIDFMAGSLPLRSMGTSSCFPPFLLREITFMTFFLLSQARKLFQKRDLLLTLMHSERPKL